MTMLRGKAKNGLRPWYAKKLMLIAALVATTSAFGWINDYRNVVIDGRTFYCNFFGEENVWSNVFVRSISPSTGDVFIPDDIDGAPVTDVDRFNGNGTTSVRLPPTMTSIDSSQFANFTSLTNINLESITSYGSYAFQNCTNLDTIIYIRTNTTFGIDTSQTGIKRACTFAGCQKLRRVEIDEGVIAIDAPAIFHGCGIEQISLPSSLRRIVDNAFGACALREVILPDSVTDLSKSAFYNCTNLTRVVIGDGVKNLEGTFSGCSALTDVSFGANLTNIGNSAFSGCTSLSEIAIPTGVAAIGDDAFRDCANLRTVTIPDGVTTIGSGAFLRNCRLVDVVLPNSVTSLGGAAFEGCSNLLNVVIPDGVASIRGETFYGCSSLTNVAIPAGVTSIGGRAFEYCTSLPDIVLPAELLSIGSEAFRESGLNRIDIPDSVTNIGEYAFYLCNGITNIVIGKGLQQSDKNAFDHVSPQKVIAYGALPTLKAGGLPYWNPKPKYVVTSEHLHSWLPWLIEKNLNYAILDGDMQSEVRVAFGDGGVDSVGVMSALGLSPARSADASGAVVTYAMPEINIETFDPATGCVDVLVAPADGGAVSGDIVTSCVAVEGSNNLSDWESVSRVELDAAAYRSAESEGRFSCTFDASGHHFYRLKVVGR